MNLIALMPCRNEDWIIGLSLRAALLWNDSVVVLLHACVDRSFEIVREIADENPGRVHVIVEENPAWAEMDHRQRLLLKARSLGATHISLVDADEVLTGNLLGQIRNQIEQMPPAAHLEVGMLAVWRSLDHFRVGGSVWANRFDLVIAFKDAPHLYWGAENGYEHHHRAPHGSRCGLRQYMWHGGVMHLQWASWPRLVAKHRAYRVMERIKYPSKSVAEIERTYSQGPNEYDLMLAAIEPAWWQPYAQWRQYVNLDAAPWHQKYVDEMISIHGRDYFKGLNVDGEPVSAPDMYTGVPQRATVEDMRASLERFYRPA